MINDFFQWLLTGTVSVRTEKLSRAAQKGNPIAQLKLGICYLKGDGVSPDTNESIRWLRRAARQGDKEAMFCLGRTHASSFGRLRKPELAYAWFEMAAFHGHKKAAKELSEIVKTMTSEQIEEGKVLSREMDHRGQGDSSLSFTK